MFGFSFWEIAIVLGIALIVLGPTKLPELAKSLGKGIREFRRATEDFKSSVDSEMHKPDPPKAIPEPVEEDVAELLPPEATEPAATPKEESPPEKKEAVEQG